MRIRDVVYLGSYGYAQPLPDAIGPEFAFVGRSNVGKSSLINKLVGRRNIARTSNAPGKTRTANFYSINDEFCFVDLPGYGYAQVSKRERARWDKLIAHYLGERKALRGVVHLLDIRHSPSSADRDTSRALHESDRPVCLVFNKIDKVKKRDLHRRIASYLETLGAGRGTAVVPFSADTGVGKRALWAWIEDRLSL